MLEYEQLLKVFFAENGTTADLLRTLDDARAWAHRLTLQNIEVGGRTSKGAGRSPSGRRSWR